MCVCAGDDGYGDDDSILFMLECQANYIVQLLGRLAAHPGAALSVKEAAVHAFDVRMQRALATMPWSRGCSNWYKTKAGRLVNNWPFTCTQYWLETISPRWADFTLCPAPATTGTHDD
jgi:hypothetical protein